MVWEFEALALAEGTPFSAGPPIGGKRIFRETMAPCKWPAPRPASDQVDSLWWLLRQSVCHLKIRNGPFGLLGRPVERLE